MSEHTLIDRYVHAVGNQLGGQEREDIQMELRSTLHDMLEERGLEAANPDHEEQLVALLKEFGAPYTIAEAYLPKRYLIGPRYFPIYVRVLKIVALIMAGLVTVASLLGGLEGQGLLEQLGHLFSSYTSTLFQSAGIITLIFFVLERSGAADEEIEADLAARDWDPRKLPFIKEVDRVDYFEVIVELLFGLGFLMGLNAIFGIIGPPAEFMRNWEYTPDVIEEILPFVPYMVALFGIEVILKSYVLLRGVWTRASRWVEFGLSVADTIVLAVILAQAPFSTLEWLDITIKVSLITALLIVGGSGLVQLYRLLWPQRPLPWRRLGKELQ